MILWGVFFPSSCHSLFSPSFLFIFLLSSYSLSVLSILLLSLYPITLSFPLFSSLFFLYPVLLSPFPFLPLCSYSLYLLLYSLFPSFFSILSVSPSLFPPVPRGRGALSCPTLHYTHGNKKRQNAIRNSPPVPKIKVPEGSNGGCSTLYKRNGRRARGGQEWSRQKSAGFSPRISFLEKGTGNAEGEGCIPTTDYLWELFPFARVLFFLVLEGKFHWVSLGWR